VNDQHGHAAGDVVLRGVAEIVSGMMRNTDVPSRYGGEEFLIVLPQNTAEGALVLSERLRGSVEAARFEVTGGRKASITASFGVAEYAVDLDTPDQLVACADRALYAAKQQGRNRVCRGAVSGA
jgi:diguanylate cyclase (GGDEF)-like protein